MENSVFLAQLMGPTLIVMGIGLAFDPSEFRKIADEFLRSPALIFVAGLLAFVPGLAVVLTHNVWVGWPLIITLLGWLAVIGGAFRLLMPQRVARIGMAVMDRRGWSRAGGVGILLLGAVLCFFGFFR
jgi:hypothetical protein